MQDQLMNAWNKMIGKLGEWLDAIVINLPNIIIAILVFIIVIILSRYTSKIMLKLLQKTKLQHSMKRVIAKISSMLIIALGMFLILGILNLSKALNTILAGAGVLGLAVGLALQGALSNTYSGIILSYIKTLKFGDWIKSNDYEGEVMDINLRAVTIKQADNNLVYIPNKLVLENPIVNYSTTSQSRVILDCGVGYSSDLKFVEKITREAITTNFKAVEKTGDIIFLYKEFGGSSINFELRFWIDSTSAIEVARAKSKAIVCIKQAFDNNDINIPFPIRTLDFPKNFMTPLNNQNDS
ncbi:small-conductance mechanosensitive channel MscS [Aquimarina addita]|uniref:Small-conductance mechanosensitive channel MscS n=1 Tax=Aquimarina addita TaxID=870485 RepID=A0ABP7X7X7_9FLAO